MNQQVNTFVGVDLHKKSITICAVNQVREVLKRKTIYCRQVGKIADFFRQLGPFQVVVEATASYEWFLRLVEPMANRVVLAHPGNLRVIAESTRKSDKLDAKLLAEFLAMDMIPEAYRPTPRQREHRNLVRHRQYLSRRITSVKNKIRRILSDYNADQSNLFTVAGSEHLDQVEVSPEHRFILEELRAELQMYDQQLQNVNRRLKEFAKSAPQVEKEARALLHSIPGVGTVTVEVVLSEIGDIRRFRSAKKVSSYAGLNPGFRSSAGKSKQLGITKDGSGLLRWVLVEAAWRTIRHSSRWRTIFERFQKRMGKKRAIVAVARRLLGVMVAILREGQPYRHSLAG